MLCDGNHEVEDTSEVYGDTAPVPVTNVGPYILFDL